MEKFDVENIAITHTFRIVYYPHIIAASKLPAYGKYLGRWYDVGRNNVGRK